MHLWGARVTWASPNGFRAEIRGLSGHMQDAELSDGLKLRMSPLGLAQVILARPYFPGARVNADAFPASAATIHPGLPSIPAAAQAEKPRPLAWIRATSRPRELRTTSSR